MLRDPIIAAIRTAVAAGVVTLLGWLVGLGVEIPDGFGDSLGVVAFGVAVAGYNLAVSFLERRVHPWFGVLLGVPKAPTYTDRHVADA